MIEIETRKEAASRAARLDAVFAALADQTRRAIVERLSCNEARVTEVAEPFHMSLNAVSKHVRALETSGVVVRHRKGRDIFSPSIPFRWTRSMAGSGGCVAIGRNG